MMDNIVQYEIEFLANTCLAEQLAIMKEVEKESAFPNALMGKGKTRTATEVKQLEEARKWRNQKR